MISFWARLIRFLKFSHRTSAFMLDNYSGSRAQRNECLESKELCEHFSAKDQYIYDAEADRSNLGSIWLDLSDADGSAPPPPFKSYKQIRHFFKKKNQKKRAQSVTYEFPEVKKTLKSLWIWNLERNKFFWWSVYVSVNQNYAGGRECCKVTLPRKVFSEISKGTFVTRFNSKTTPGQESNFTPWWPRKI